MAQSAPDDDAAPESAKEYDHETKPGQEDNKRRRTASHGGFPTYPPDADPDGHDTGPVDGARERLRRPERE
nr:hypothetical protein [uncultured Lichenicoccus sp.]